MSPSADARLQLRTPGRPGWEIDPQALAAEIEELRAAVRSTAATHYDATALRAAHARLGGRILPDPPDPFDRRTIEPVRQALLSRRPFSAIRLGDGEANILTYGMYPDAANLDILAVDQALFGFMDSFIPDRLWAATLRDLLFGAVLAADMIGLVGLWYGGDLTPKDRAEATIEGLGNNVRGLSGNWRAIDYPLRLAHLGCLSGKTLGSAHFYFGMAAHLDPLIDAAGSVICITNRAEVVSKLAHKHPGTPVDGILLRDTRPPAGDLPDSPRFLAEVEARLPRDMTGCLCLIGAGVWSEIYCTWVKLRGGVAVDIGSAFDLMDGRMTRSVHFGLQKSGIFDPDLLRLD